MLQTPQNAEKSRIDMLGTCTSSSPIYAASSQDLCILELFRDLKKGVKKKCQVKILVDTILPKAMGRTTQRGHGNPDKQIHQKLRSIIGSQSDIPL